MTFFLIFNISWEGGPPILNLPRASGMLRPALTTLFAYSMYIHVELEPQTHLITEGWNYKNI